MKLFLLLLAFWGGSAHALVSDTTIGNGGDVVNVLGGNGWQFYLLDLYETGVAENPYFDDSLEVPADIRERVKKVFGDSGTASLLGRKIAEITARDSLLGSSLLRTLELLRWKTVDYKLINVPDEGTVYDGELFQAAIRQGATIFLQRGLWDNMADDKQRAALILHELIYALYKPEVLKEGQKVQRSYRVREINSYFFDESWKRNSAEEFYRTIDGKLPTSGESGIKVDPSDASKFSVAPMLVMDGNLPTHNNIAVNSFAGLRTKIPEEIDENGRISSICEDFSSSYALEVKSGFYGITLMELDLRLQRGSYNSPLGILDYIEWSPAEDFLLPPYEQDRVTYPRLRAANEAFRVLSSRVIFDFSKFAYSPRIAEKARQACLSFFESGMKEFGPLLNEYK